ACRPTRLPHQRDPALADAESALALSQYGAGHVLRARRADPDLPAAAEAGGAARTGRDLLGAGAAPTPGDQRRRELGHLPGAARHRRIRLRAAVEVQGLKHAVFASFKKAALK